MREGRPKADSVSLLTGPSEPDVRVVRGDLDRKEGRSTGTAYRPVGTRAWSSENQFVLRDRHLLEQLLVPVQDDVASIQPK